MTEDYKKILLLGGTSETESLALRLAISGYRVLVSTATDETLQIGEHENVTRRCGRIGQQEMVSLLVDGSFSALVDATHPYASEAHQTAQRACKEAGLSYLRYQRREIQTDKSDWLLAENHEQAALLACETGAPILLTTGSRNLKPYVREARRKKVSLYARVLEHEESIRACDDAGLDESQRIFSRGPHSFEDNVQLIHRYRIGVVVSKESGAAGGVMEKWLAAKEGQCRFVVVKRPAEKLASAFSCMDELLHCLSREKIDVV